MGPPAYSLSALYPSNPNTERGASTKLHISKDSKLVYANGRTVIIRDLKNPTNSKAYAGHSRNVTVARFSPSGYYCASADITGTVRVWDTVGEDNILKGEYPAVGGKINDLAWDGESKRIIAVGDGRETFGKAFMMDSGTSVGEIGGHSKVVNAVSIRHQRPFKAATASDDCSIVFHSGVPFKFDKTIKTHTKFVQDVKFSPSGDHFASVGSDAKVFLYDGKTGDTIGELGGEVHKGSIMSVNWSPDSKTIVTSSMDCTVKLWDLEQKKTTHTWSMGSGVQNQQVGNAWGPEGDIVSLAMSGIVSVFDQRKGDGFSRLLYGPQKSIMSGALTTSGGTFLAGAADGRIVSYDLASESGEVEYVSGTTHTSLVTGLASSKETNLSVGFDDMLKEISVDGKSMTNASTKLAAQAKGLALSDEGTAFVAETNCIEAFRSNQRVAQLPVKYTPGGVASTGKLVAVGGDDNKIHLYSWNGVELKELGESLETPRGPALALAVSPNGKLLVSGDATGKMVLFDLDNKKTLESRWTNHAARIYSLAFTPSSSHIASGSLDGHVFVWSVASPLSNVAIRHAGPGGVNAVTWLPEDAKEKDGKKRLASAGADGCVRVWEVKLPA